MSEQYDFNNLFVLDLANNHQGDVEHGLNIIRAMGEVTKKHGVKAALKFQFRQLDSFIHSEHRESETNKHISRFLSTELGRGQYQTLLDEVRRQGLVSMCTPFDEESVDIIADMGFDIIKVASCSAKDWPLIEKVAYSGMPVVFSSGGLKISDIDNLVAFFSHRGVDHSIMHCVSIYPIPDEHFQLNQIDSLRRRYPDTTIGWSTHENPDDQTAVGIAVAKGALMFERHVGIETKDITLNAYSSTPEQIDKWLAAHTRARHLCGAGERPAAPEVETESIDSLRRGVFARKPIKGGAEVAREDVYFAMPYLEGQLESGRWPTQGLRNITAAANVESNAPLMLDEVNLPDDGDYLTIKRAVHEVKAMLNEARIVLNSDFKVEYSHHYGIPRFREVGAVLIECVNRSYCKKLIVQLPGQHHPNHHHVRKEETFQVLYGVLHVEIDNHTHVLHPGEILLVQPGVWHRFWTDTGVIFEEISSTHYNNDSFYKDQAINRLERSERKTVLDHWGRYWPELDSNPLD
jgi:sialic acid synthase SpsE/D-lyxose ketol-isomerase